MAGPLLVGYDGTPGAQAAAAEALTLASELGAEVIFGFAYWTNPQGGEVADMLAALRELGEGHLRDAQAHGRGGRRDRPRRARQRGAERRPRRPRRRSTTRA